MNAFFNAILICNTIGSESFQKEMLLLLWDCFGTSFERLWKVKENKSLQYETRLFCSFYITEILSPGSENSFSNLCSNMFQLSKLHLRHFPDRRLLHDMPTEVRENADLAVILYSYTYLLSREGSRMEGVSGEMGIWTFFASLASKSIRMLLREKVPSTVH